MPFPFSQICILFSTLEGLRLRDPPFLRKDLQAEERRAVESWFRNNRRVIENQTDGAAFLSTLLPEHRTDRVYALRETRLLRLIPRCLHLNSERTRLLHSCITPGNGDLGQCVEKALKDFDIEPKPGQTVTVEEIDEALELLAAGSKFSAPEVRLRSRQSPVGLLSPILLRLSSSECKWLVRLILKNFGPVIIDPGLIYNQYHFLLAGLLRFQDSFPAAVALIKGPYAKFPSQPGPESQRYFKGEAARLISPQVGIKVGRPNFFKARSIDHCLKMLGTREWSLERKYDGEYVEIHVDLENHKHLPFRIFSKSGKDSTNDRKALHKILRECLRIGQKKCAFKRRCILVGEMVVYSEDTQSVMEFHEIRKHVSRSGRFIGAYADSVPNSSQHLMMVFYDVLLVDDEITMTLPHRKRRGRLSEIVQKKQGYAITAEWQIQDFSTPHARLALMSRFAEALACRTEGLVLKPTDSPYFTFDPESDDYCGYFVKLKKDYMSEFGEDRDVADFVVVGASFDPSMASKARSKSIRFTTFFLGCLNNPSAVRYGAPPMFDVVEAIHFNQCVPAAEFRDLNHYINFNSVPFDESYTLNHMVKPHDTLPKIQVLLTEPCVVEVLGSGYWKPPNRNFRMLRHPRILKLHLDRNWEDAITEEGLQDLADKATNDPSQGESQETARLLDRMMQRFMRKRQDQRQRDTACTQITAQETVSTSPRRPLKSRGGNSPSLVRIDTCELNEEERFERQRDHNHPNRRSPGGESHKAASLNVGTTLSPFRAAHDSSATIATSRSSGGLQESELVSPPSSGEVRLASSSRKRPRAAESAYSPQKKKRLSQCAVILFQSVADIEDKENILKQNGATIVDSHDVGHWIRDSFEAEEPMMVVPESQAYPGLTKVMIIGSQDISGEVHQLLAANVKDTVVVTRWEDALEWTKNSG